MIEVRGLFFSHRSTGTMVLKGLSLEVAQASLTTILGPNGSGKTTLLKCMAGLWRPQAGRIKVHGKDIWKLKPSQRARLMAYVPQNHHLVFPYRVLDVVLMGRAPYLSPLAAPGEKDRRMALEMLQALDIAHLCHRPFFMLSGGERQLVMVARSLVQQSPVMLLDEPTSHLDFKNQIHLMGLLRDLVQGRGLTVLVTLHDPNLAAAFSQELLLLKDGAIIHRGDVHQTITSQALSQLYGIKVAVMGGTRKVVYSVEN